jgi:DNA topoisomerase-1
VAARDRDKYDRLVAFADALPGIRARVDRDLRRRGLPREKVLAGIVRLLELTLIRVGNDEYARDNRSFGLATLRPRHVSATPTRVRFHFRGKSGRTHDIIVRDRTLARLVRRCLDLGGREVFAWLDDDRRPVDVTADDVNAYLADIADVSSKDFRTWAGTVLAWRALRAVGPPTSAREADRNVVAAIRDTADRLGNTAAVCRRSYVHPAVVDAYETERLQGALVEAVEAGPDAPGGTTPTEDAAVRRLLDRRARRRGRTGRRSD